MAAFIINASCMRIAASDISWCLCPLLLHRACTPEKSLGAYVVGWDILRYITMLCLRGSVFGAYPFMTPADIISTRASTARYLLGCLSTQYGVPQHVRGLNRFSVFGCSRHTISKADHATWVLLCDLTTAYLWTAAFCGLSSRPAFKDSLLVSRSL